MVVEKLLALIPDHILTELAVETGVDYYAKKLQGEVVFKLLLHCLLTSKETSLRSAASAYESTVFAAINSQYLKAGSVRYNSISERLSTIEYSYFEKLYKHCVRAYSDTIGSDHAECLLRFDSTIVTLSAKLLGCGYRQSGAASQAVRQLKFTVGLGAIPQQLQLYTDQRHNSENVALKETILRWAQKKQADQQLRTTIAVFDRGLCSRLAFDELSEQGVGFVCRINAGARYTLCSPNQLAGPRKTDSGLLITEDIGVRLYGKATSKIQTRHPLRLIKACRTENASQSRQREFWFLTNIGPQTLSAEAVAAVYRRRWEIEVFFRFIKQHLNFSHLLSRNENGMRVVLYITMIAATLLLAYRKLDAQSGYKITKQRLAQDLEHQMLITLITLCGGNPDKLNQILPANTS